MSRTYRVVIKGISVDKSVGQVAEALSAPFKLPKEKVIFILQAPQYIVKQGLDLASAVRYEEAFRKYGCVCIVEPELETQQQAPSATTQTVAQPPSSATPQSQAPSASIQTVAQPSSSAPPQFRAASASTQKVAQPSGSSSPMSQSTGSASARAKDSPPANRVNDKRTLSGAWRHAPMWQKAFIATLLLLGGLSWLVLASRSPTSNDNNSSHAAAPTVIGTWICGNDRNSGRSEISFASNGTLQWIDDPGTVTVAHRIGHYHINQQQVAILIEQIPEMKKLGQSPSVSIEEGALITSLESSSLGFTWWQADAPNDRLAFTCNRIGNAQAPKEPVAQSTAPKKNTQMKEEGQVSTAGGTLKLFSGRDTSDQWKLTLNGRQIWESNDYFSVSIEETFGLQASTAVLLGVNEGGNACEGRQRFVLVSRSGEVKVTEEFGNCAPREKYGVDTEGIHVTFPSIDINMVGTETWTLKDGILSGPKKVQHPKYSEAIVAQAVVLPTDGVTFVEVEGRIEEPANARESELVFSKPVKLDCTGAIVDRLPISSSTASVSAEQGHFEVTIVCPQLGPSIADIREAAIKKREGAQEAREESQRPQEARAGAIDFNLQGIRLGVTPAQVLAGYPKPNYKWRCVTEPDEKAVGIDVCGLLITSDLVTGLPPGAAVDKIERAKPATDDAAYIAGARVDKYVGTFLDGRLVQVQVGFTRGVGSKAFLDFATARFGPPSRTEEFHAAFLGGNVKTTVRHYYWKHGANSLAFVPFQPGADIILKNDAKRAEAEARLTKYTQSK